MFMETFKYYKSKSNPPDLSDVIDFEKPVDDKVSHFAQITIDCSVQVFTYPQIAEPVALQNTTTVSQYLGVLPTVEWKVYRLKENPGLIFIKNPFTCHGQRYWISRCLRDYPKLPHEKNKFNLKKTSDDKANIDWWSSLSAPETNQKDRVKLKTALRWVTLGYHHDWDTKVYTENKKHKFPRDLAKLSSFVAEVLGFSDYSAEAAIVNYYPLGTTLAGHTDHSEKNLDAPLFSYRFEREEIHIKKIL